MGHVGWALFFLTFFPNTGFASALSCSGIIGVPVGRPTAIPLPFSMPGLEVASLSDPSHSTGATLFYFPRGARLSADIRGGSAATIETSLLGEGSYSNVVDGLVFSGGSTMGLGVTDGVRSVLFEQNQNSNSFDFIPSVPGAVVYDFGGRILPNQLTRIYPGREFGQSLMNYRSTNSFPMGRVGAGTSTTVNKIGRAYWGGQGAAYRSYPWGNLFAAVVLNAMGDVQNNGMSYSLNFPGVTIPAPKVGQNTTLSVIVTDVTLDRNQLKRLSMMVHTGMAARILPFHTYYDGDVNFAASLAQRPAPASEDDELVMQMAAADLMREAIVNSVLAANEPALFP